MDPEDLRISELEFLELCTRLVAYNKDTSFISTFFKALKYIIDFNPAIVIEVSKEIFEPKYQLGKVEKVKILKRYGYTVRDISKICNISLDSVTRYSRMDYLLYPRSSKEQQREIHKFMQQYRILFNIDIRNIM